jgi:hypothetical protein
MSWEPWDPWLPGNPPVAPPADSFIPGGTWYLNQPTLRFDGAEIRLTGWLGDYNPMVKLTKNKVTEVFEVRGGTIVPSGSSVVPPPGPKSYVPVGNYMYPDNGNWINAMQDITVRLVARYTILPTNEPASAAYLLTNVVRHQHLQVVPGDEGRPKLVNTHGSSGAMDALEDEEDGEEDASDSFIGVTAIFDKEHLWPFDDKLYHLKYCFHPNSGNVENLDADKKQVITEAFTHYNNLGIRFALRFSETSDWNAAQIRIGLDASKNDSTLGGGTQLLTTPTGEWNVNIGCRKSITKVFGVKVLDRVGALKTALHEIGHVCALEHEFFHQDVQLVEAAVNGFFRNRQPFPVRNTKEIKRQVLDPKLQSDYPYDNRSIMNYDFPKECFSRPADAAEHGTQREARLSDRDKTALLDAYHLSRPG